MLRILMVIALSLGLLASCGGQRNPFDHTPTTSQHAEQPVNENGLDVYCSCGPTTVEKDSVEELVGDNSLVAGALVRIAWADLEPSPGEYRFDLVQRQVDLANDAGKKITLAILNGPHAPAWLKDLGTAYFSYTTQDGQSSEIPLSWDATYLENYTRLIGALGDIFSGIDTIQLVHMTNASTNGFEMQYALRPEDETRFLDAGYTVERYVESWQKIISVYSASFPTTPLDIEIHPVLGDADLPRSIVNHGYSIIGSRFGVFAAWWSADNAIETYPEMEAILAEAAQVSFAGVQLAGTVSGNGNRMSEDDFIESLNRASDLGATYVEIWNADLENQSLMAKLEELFDRMLDKQYAK